MFFNDFFNLVLVCKDIEPRYGRTRTRDFFLTVRVVSFTICECIRHLNVRIGEHIGISPLTRKQVKPKNSSIADQLLLCNHSASYDDFSILTRDNSKFLLELKESLLILRDKASLNRNITSAPWYLFDKA